MCGRYGLKTSFSTLAKLLRAEPLDPDVGEWGPDFNIAPTDLAPVVVADPDGHWRLGLFRWGLVPFWADDPKVGARMINARAETVADKPAFRDAFAKRRLLVPASGWYEWRHASPEPGQKKKDLAKPTPTWIHAADDAQLMLAGLGATWKDKQTGQIRKTFAIITTDAAPSVSAIHDRMPVVVPPETQALWLSPDSPPPLLADLLHPYYGPLAFHEVSTVVNDVKADGPDLIAPAKPPKQGTLL